MEANNTQKRLNFYCQLMIVLLGLIAVRLWMMPADLLPRAQAQFMDAGAQRMKLLKAVEKTNALLGDVNDTLRGTLKVRIEDDNGDTKTDRGSHKKKS